MRKDVFITQKVALKNLARRPVRTWCMIFFVFILAATLFCSSVLTYSMEESVEKTTDRMGADIIVVPEEYEEDMADSLFLGELCDFTFDRKWTEQIGAIEGIESATPQLYMASLAATCCSSETQLIAYDPETDFIIKPWLEKDGLGELKTGEMYIGSSITPPDKDSIRFFNEQYKVAGQLEKTGTSYDTCVFMTVETAQQIMDSDGWKAIYGESGAAANELVSSYMIRVKDGADVKAIARKINYSMEEAPVSAYTTNGIFSGVTDSIKNMTTYSALLLALLLVLVVVALVLTYTITMNERTREFGLLASLGVDNVKLGRIILTEGTLIGLTGGILGAGLALIVLKIFAVPITVKLSIPRLDTDFLYMTRLGLACVLLSVVISILASFYSIWKVSHSEIDGLIKGEEL